MTSFAAEVDRLVRSPYPVSSKPLYDIATDVDGRLIERWAIARPCQVAPLITAVLEGLELWPCALGLLEKLARVDLLRDEVVCQKPILLDTLLRKAAVCQQDFPQYAAACVTLLSTPLPPGLAMPASLPAFLSRLIDVANQSPSAATIKPVYALLIHQNAALLELLAVDQLQRFREKLLRILKTFEDQSVDLLCLGVFARLASPGLNAANVSTDCPRTESSPHEEIDAPQGPISPLSVQYFFREKKASKTIHLATIRVVLACSESRKCSLSTALESTSLATEIVNCVTSKSKSEWIENNPKLMQKLYDKILRLGLPPNLQAQALMFVAGLTENKPLPSSIVASFQQLVLVSLDPLSEDSGTTQLPTSMMEVFLGRVDNKFVATVLEAILHACAEATAISAQGFRSLESSLSVLCSLILVAKNSPLLRASVACAPVANELSRVLTILNSCPLSMNPIISCHDLEVCPVAWAETRRALGAELCSLFLRSRLQCQIDSTTVDDSLALSMLDMQGHFATLPPTYSYSCSTLSPTNASGPVLLEHTSTPDSHQSSRKWREQLASDLSRDAKHTHETIIRKVGEICRDLEDRCHQVEAPLREEQARSASLEQELRSSQERVCQLESELGEHKHLLSGMNTEMAELKHEIQLLESRLEDSTGTARQLDSRLKEVMQSAETSKLEFAAEMEKTKEKELELQALIAIRDESMEHFSAEVDGMQKLAGDLENQLKAANEEAVHARSLIKELEDNLAHITQEKENLKRELAENKDSIASLQNSEQSLRRDAMQLNEKLQFSSKETESLRAEFGNTERTLMEQIDIIRHDRNAEKEETAAKEARMNLVHQDALHHLENKLRRQEQKAAMEHQRKEAKIIDLEAKLTRLEQDKMAKAREFAEAQDLSRRLMTIMKPDRADGAHIQPTYSPDDHGNVLFDMPTAGLNHQIGDQSRTKSSHLLNREGSLSNGSSTSTASQQSPTPKRFRSRKSLKASTQHQARVVTGNGARMSTSGQNPLRQLHDGANRASTGSQVKLHETEDVMGLEHCSSYAGNDVFDTGTEVPASAGQAPVFDCLDEDDTTADF